DTKNRKVLEGPGYWLGSIRESELEKVLCSSIKTASDIANEYKDLQGDTDTTQSLHEIRVKELKNELEQVMRNSTFKDGLIFCLRSRVSDLEDELEQISLKSDPSSNDSKMGGDAVEEISLKPDPSSNDSKTGGDAIEEISSFSKNPSLSSHHLGLEPDESKIKDV
ncbi:15292_t:CDS:2, partial [Dentiscutata heterogama]